MKTKISLLVVITVFLPSFPAAASVLTLNDALRATYGACVGIDEELADLKKMAFIRIPSNENQRIKIFKNASSTL